MLSCRLIGCLLGDLATYGGSGAEREREYGKAVSHALKDTINIAAEICGKVPSREGWKLQKLFDLVLDVKVRHEAGSLGHAVNVASAVKRPNPDYCTRQ
jgi:hypothetical protein